MNSIKFLIDHQLPPALAELLRNTGHEAKHVRELGLKSDDDLTIWKHATEHNYIVISKDQDFFYLACRSGDEGRLVWVRLGNCRNQPLLDKFERNLPQILNSFAEGSRIVELN
jgi:predicted nuclease of predicted toxin-antitoxin system